MTHLAGRMAIIFETPDGMRVIAKGFFRQAEMEVDYDDFDLIPEVFLQRPFSQSIMRAEMVLEGYTLYTGDEFPDQQQQVEPRRPEIQG